MRPILIGLCVFAAACSGEQATSPTAPTSAGLGLASTQAQSGTELPFRGSFTTVTTVPPPFPQATAQGVATQLGQFTARLSAAVNPDGTSTGTVTLTAANRDELYGTFTGQGIFVPPNAARLTEVVTIEQGTGRFTGATGTFTMVRFDTIDLATGTATGTGTFEGQINLRQTSVP